MFTDNELQVGVRLHIGTSTICQHCFGNNRGVEAGGPGIIEYRWLTKLA